MISKHSSTILTFWKKNTKYYLSVLEIKLIKVLYEINRENKYLFSLTFNHSHKSKVFVKYYHH